MSDFISTQQVYRKYMKAKFAGWEKLEYRLTSGSLKRLSLR